MEDYKDHIDQELFEQIEAYLLHTMTTEERSRFETQLAADPSLQKELELQRQLLAIATVESFNTDQQSSIENSSAASRPSAIVKSISKWWWAAAAMLILISGFWYLQSKSVSPQQLANQYFSPDPGLPVTMSSSSQYQFYDGMVSYKEADYEKAIAIWKSIATNNRQSDTLHYFIGVAYLNRDQYNDALQQLLPLAEGNSNWKEKASWYLSLTYLKLNQPQKAQKWLQTIPSYPESPELLEAINNLIGD
jgi:tetratricopeptide (TPR) repeat protein